MNGIITMASASSSSLFGNVGCAVKELILSKFPNDYFKYTNVSTEVAFKNMRRYFGKNTDTEIRKRQFPYLIIQPTYQVPDSDSFLQGINLTKNIDDLQFGIDNRSLFSILNDDENGYNLKFKLNRDKIDFEVRIVVQTLHQQLDLYKAMTNHIVWDRSFFHAAALEAVIPKNIINYCGKLCNLDIERNPNLIPQFLKHMNNVSGGYPITYKMRNASATDEYFMYYMHNLVITFSDLSIENGNRKNMVDDMYELTFRVSAEFNLPGLYIIDGDINKALDFKIQLVSSGIGESESNSDYIPLYTFSNLWQMYPSEKDNLKLYGAFVFQTDAADDGTDSISLECLMDENYIRAIKSYQAYNMPNTLIKAYVLMNKTELVEGKDYTTDWEGLTLHIKDADDTATYRLILYVNASKINEIIKDMLERDRISDKSSLKENKI